MSGDDIKGQLEDLFSGVSVPDPNGEKTDAKPKTPQLQPYTDAKEPRDAYLPGQMFEDAGLQTLDQSANWLQRLFVGWRYSLRRALMLAFLFVAIAPAFILLIFSIFSQRSRLQANVIDNLELLATLQENQTEQWIQSQSSAFVSFASEPSLERQNRILLRSEPDDAEYDTAKLDIVGRMRVFLVQYAFDEMLLLNLGGQVLVSTDTIHENHIEKDMPYFVGGLKDTYYGSVSRCERWDKLCIVVAEPVVYITGETLGVMVGLIKTDPLAQLVQEAPGLGNTGETYLVNAQGMLINPLRSEGLEPSDLIDSRGIKKALAQESGQGTYNNYAGRPVLGVYRWLPEVELGLLTEQEVSEAYRPIFLAAAGIVAVALLAILLTVLLSSQLARRIAQPLVEMTESAKMMMAGDLNQAVAVTRTDEIGALGQAFNHMTRQLRTVVVGLEEKVEERTDSLQRANSQLQRRAIQLEVSAQVGRAAASILDPQEMMQTTVDLIRRRFNFYHVTIFLLDEEGERAIARASTGTVGRKMMLQSFEWAINGDSLVSWVCNYRQPRIVLGVDAVRFGNSLLPDTRSEMALPLAVGDRLLGVLDVQSTEETAFDDDDLRTLQGMADQVAIALENAQRFAQARYGAQHQQLVTQITKRTQQVTSVTDILGVAVQGLAETFDLAQATICLGAEAEMVGRENDREQEKDAPMSTGQALSPDVE